MGYSHVHNYAVSRPTKRSEESEQTELKSAIVSAKENGKSKQATTMSARNVSRCRRLKVGQKGGQVPQGTFSQAAIAERYGRLYLPNLVGARSEKSADRKILSAKKGLRQRSQAIVFFVLLPFGCLWTPNVRTKWNCAMWKMPSSIGAYRTPSGKCDSKRRDFISFTREWGSPRRGNAIEFQFQFNWKPVIIAYGTAWELRPMIAFGPSAED